MSVKNRVFLREELISLAEIFQPVRYLQEQRTADDASKSPFIHLGEIPIPVKVTGQEHTNLRPLKQIEKKKNP